MWHALTFFSCGSAALRALSQGAPQAAARLPRADLLRLLRVLDDAAGALALASAARPLPLQQQQHSRVLPGSVTAGGSPASPPQQRDSGGSSRRPLGARGGVARSLDAEVDAVAGEPASASAAELELAALRAANLDAAAALRRSRDAHLASQKASTGVLRTLQQELVAAQRALEAFSASLSASPTGTGVDAGLGAGAGADPVRDRVQALAAAAESRARAAASEALAAALELELQGAYLALAELEASRAEPQQPHQLSSGSNNTPVAAAAPWEGAGLHSPPYNAPSRAAQQQQQREREREQQEGVGGPDSPFTRHEAAAVGPGSAHRSNPLYTARYPCATHLPPRDPISA